MLQSNDKGHVTLDHLRSWANENQAVTGQCHVNNKQGLAVHYLNSTGHLHPALAQYYVAAFGTNNPHQNDGDDGEDEKENLEEEDHDDDVVVAAGVLTGKQFLIARQVAREHETEEDPPQAEAVAPEPHGLREDDPPEAEAVAAQPDVQHEDYGPHQQPADNPEVPDENNEAPAQDIDIDDDNHDNPPAQDPPRDSETDSSEESSEDDEQFGAASQRGE
jgi:hypothetical protein